MKQKSQGLSKAKELEQLLHLTRPPRLEGKVKNAKMYSERKRKKIRIPQHESIFDHDEFAE